MIDRTADGRASVPVHQNHFHGNGTCDAMREANKREDRMGVQNTQSGSTNGQNGGAWAGNTNGQNSAARPYTGMESEIAPYYGQTAMTPYNGSGETTAAEGYDDPAYGPGHEWTSEEENGMNSAPQDTFDEPLNAEEAARSSWRALLARNVGRNVLVRFLMGTQNLITVEGELYEVGSDYIVIYQPLWDSHITADLYAVKFVEFREPPGVVTLE